MLADQLEQPIEVERFLEKRDAVEIRRPRLIERRQDDHRHVGQRRIPLLTPPELPPVHHWHHEIEQDHVRAIAVTQVVEGVAAIGHGGGIEPFESQQLRHHVAQVRIVFDDEHRTLGVHVNPSIIVVLAAVHARRRYLIRGRVQGVGFRFFTQAAASREGLCGWVRNTPDGSVETAVEGERDAVDRFERQIRRGPPGARVDRVDVSEEQAGGAEPNFTIR
jgi:acylphosphatase